MLAHHPFRYKPSCSRRKVCVPLGAEIKYLSDHHPTSCKYRDTVARFVSDDRLAMAYKGNLSIEAQTPDAAVYDDPVKFFEHPGALQRLNGTRSVKQASHAVPAEGVTLKEALVAVWGLRVCACCAPGACACIPLVLLASPPVVMSVWVLAAFRGQVLRWLGRGSSVNQASGSAISWHFNSR